MIQTSAPVAVVGMHRSGTSCLAGCLQDLGLSLGAVNEHAPHNLKGNRENPAFWPLHDSILDRVGAAWDRPPTDRIAWTADEKARLRDLLTDYASLTPPWGFKDPRATLLLDGWFEILPDLRLVGTFRHPEAVAASLSTRNGFAPEQGWAIWTGYNRAMLDWSGDGLVAVMDYDDPDYETRIRSVAGGLGLNATAPMPFRAAELTHQTATGPVPEPTRALWNRLRAAAL